MTLYPSVWKNFTQVGTAQSPVWVWDIPGEKCVLEQRVYTDPNGEV
jgi:hypothetical protein